MRNNDWERHIARALELGAYRAELRPEDAARLRDKARDQRMAGRWRAMPGRDCQRDAYQTLPEAPPFSLARDMTIWITVRMTLEMAGDRFITGDGELVFHYHTLGLAWTRRCTRTLTGRCWKTAAWPLSCKISRITATWRISRA